MSAGHHQDDTDYDPAISCAACAACCCRLEVMLMGDDDIPVKFTVQDAWGGWVMRRLADGWCAALDRNSMKCTIYQHRPAICCDYRMGGSDCSGERSQFLDQAADRRLELTAGAQQSQRPPTPGDG